MGKLLKIKIEKSLIWENFLDDFLVFKLAQGFSDRTLIDYRWHIKRFFNQSENGSLNYETLKKEILSYFAQGKNVAPVTHNIRRKYLKAFFTWLVNERIIDKNPVDLISQRREEPRIREMDENKLKALILTPDKTTYSGLRDYALILLSLDTGIRPKEALALSVSSVNLQSLEVHISANIAKTRTSRTVPLTPPTAEAITKLISVRPQIWGNAPLFCTAEGKPMITGAWTSRVSKYGKKLGFKISSYDLRHIYALIFLRNGGNVFSLSRMMGHTDLTMTKRYLNLTQQDLREQQAIASPINILIHNKRLRKIRT